MSWASHLPAVNALLNSVAAVFLLAGLIFIKQDKKEAHRKAMLGAISMSALFLISYLIYHYQVGSVKFTAQGLPRTIYLTVLATHIVLAATVPPLALITLHRGLKARFPSHRKIARWTWPIWMYVSVTGVVVYVMLYQLYPPDPAPTQTIQLPEMRAPAAIH